MSSTRYLGNILVMFLLSCSRKHLTSVCHTSLFFQHRVICLFHALLLYGCQAALSPPRSPPAPNLLPVFEARYHCDLFLCACQKCEHWSAVDWSYVECWFQRLCAEFGHGTDCIISSGTNIMWTDCCTIISEMGEG